MDAITGTLKGIWATIKFVFTGIKEQAIGLKEVLKGAFTLDSDLINKGIGRMKGAGQVAAKAFNETMSQDLTGRTAIKNIKKIITGMGRPSPGAKSIAGGGVASAFNKKTGSGTTTTTGTKKSSTSVDGIKSGRPTHINIDIGKLIENMTITATDVEDLTGKIKDQVAQALFSAVNNVNNIAGV